LTVLYLGIFAASLLLSFVFTKFVRDIATVRGWVAAPALDRHLHLRPLPRLGGVAIFLAFLFSLTFGVLLARLRPSLGIGFSALASLWSILLPGFVVFLLGVIDDIHPVGPYVKFAVQAIAGGMLFAFGLRILDLPVLFGHHHFPWFLGLPLTILWVLAITNAFNLIDGLDGLAAGSALFSTLVVFVVSMFSQSGIVSLMALALAGSILGFLRFNFNPATIFLGDCGSLFIGFMLSALALRGAQKAPTIIAVAIPVVTFIVVPLTLASIVVPWDILLIIAHQTFASVALLLEWLSTMPAAVWQQHAPAIFAAVAGILGVLWLLAPRGVPGRSLGLIWLAPLFVIVPLLPWMGAFRITVLDVGQGLAVLVQTHTHSLLYDTGPRFSETADAGNRIIAPMLRATGVARLDGMIVSHQDNDHSGGALSLLQTVPVQWVSSSLKTDHPIVRARAERGEAVWRCLSGQTWTWDGVEFEILHPDSASYAAEKIRKNNRGCVLRISIGNQHILLAADIEKESEQQLLKEHADKLSAAMLVVPHHGSKTSSTDEFIAAVRPGYAVFTVGYLNRFGHPKQAVVQRYVGSGSTLLRSDEDGAILVEMNTQGLQVERYRKTHQRYWTHLPPP